MLQRYKKIIKYDNSQGEKHGYLAFFMLLDFHKRGKKTRGCRAALGRGTPWGCYEQKMDERGLEVGVHLAPIFYCGDDAE